MKRLLANETGTAIVTAIALMMGMTGVGLAAYSVVDTQQTEVMRDRQREGSFNFSEATLNSQAFLLSRRWPSHTSSQYPACTQANAAAAPTSCPQPAQLGASYQGPDYANVEWTTSVRDDTGEAFYKQSEVESRPAWDQNDNKSVWVRSEADVKGRHRTLVALVRIQETGESLPRRTIISGYFRTGNNGNKLIIETNSTASSPHPVTVRCNPNAGDSCAKWRSPVQVNGSVVGPEFVGQPAVSDDAVERLRDRAIADGTYFTGCPPSTAALAGKVVYVETCAEVSPTGNGTVNSEAEPGILIINNGTFRPGGNMTYHGIVYARNAQNSSGIVVDLQGGATIKGGIFVDGPGGTDVGQDKLNLSYVDNAFSSIASYGTASIVQNSWREITAD